MYFVHIPRAQNGVCDWLAKVGCKEKTSADIRELLPDFTSSDDALPEMMVIEDDGLEDPGDEETCVVCDCHVGST